MLICQLIYSQRIARACTQRLKTISRLIFYRSGQDKAQLTERAAGFGGPGVEAGLHGSAVFAVLGRDLNGSPALQRRRDRVGEDEGVLADHPQKARSGIAAHLAEAFGERLP